ncbi:MAG: Glucose-6-P dehydrogenase subunit-like protein [Bryobacterales bacterium]|jgi:glucose-6-phosphate dehydrogenase assembly protein OpcA|nr:Glucose-6-P dehydrogenase subunit-like protein [Bryobacterales bacterium]
MSCEVIKPDRILQQLAELWKDTARPEADADGDGLLRACAMTLVSFVDDEEDAMALGETLALLMREHPSRSIVVRLREGEDFLESRVFAQCWKPFGHRQQICCEQVEISATMNHLQDVAAVVGPLAVPDLPRLILLRSARIVRAGALRKILRLGDKIIVDSSLPGAPGFGELGALLESGHIAGDLAWTRITELRALIAQVIGDRVPKNIIIEYEGREAGAETRYLEAWLASGLPDTVVRLKGSGGQGTGVPAVVRVDDEITICLTPECAEIEIGQLKQHAPLAVGSADELLNAELKIVVHDEIFERVLNRITA